jgi:hypothetical protein
MLKSSILAVFIGGCLLASQNSIATDLTTVEAIEKPLTIQFTPPKDWKFAEAQSLPKSVRALVVGKGAREFPPSINLGIEPYKGTLKEYLKIVKAINDTQGAEWKDLGTILTDAGEASLSQLDTKGEWGDVRMMHVILLKEEVIYILTAASLKEEFPKFYQEFFRAMRSLRFGA